MKDNTIRIKLQHYLERGKLSHIVCLNQERKTKKQSEDNMRPSPYKHCSYAFVHAYIFVQFYLWSSWNLVPMTTLQTYFQEDTDGQKSMSTRQKRMSTTS